AGVAEVLTSREVPSVGSPSHPFLCGEMVSLPATRLCTATTTLLIHERLAAHRLQFDDSTTAPHGNSQRLARSGPNASRSAETDAAEPGGEIRGGVARRSGEAGCLTHEPCGQKQTD